MTWPEDEYLRNLREARGDYAWLMRRYGGRTWQEADAEAREAYPYESSDRPFRGIEFHEDAWHWAMLAIHGAMYWREHPELLEPSVEYLRCRGE